MHDTKCLANTSYFVDTIKKGLYLLVPILRPIPSYDGPLAGSAGVSNSR